MILPLFFLSISCLAGIEVRNGGGGWTNDGQYMTFYSAKIPVQKKALDPSQIPGLNYLVNKMFSLEITEQARTEILKAIFPVSNRSYYSANASQFDENLKEDLRRKYAEIMGMREQNIAIFATTNPSSSETVLLPDFYKLKESEQAAILFHESLWLLNPNLNYSSILAAEEAAQAYFENEQDGEKIHAFYYQLSLLMNDRTIPLGAALQFDKNRHLFPSALTANTVSLEAVFGTDFLKCMADSENAYYLVQRSNTTQRPCSEILFNTIIKFSMKCPTSVFYKSLLDYLKRGGDISFFADTPYRLDDFPIKGGAFEVVPKVGYISGISFMVLDNNNNSLGYLNFN